MYCNIQLITNIIDLIHKFGMYSRFGYNRQICQGRILYMHYTKLYTINTSQNRRDSVFNNFLLSQVKGDILKYCKQSHFSNDINIHNKTPTNIYYLVLCNTLC